MNELVKIENNKDYGLVVSSRTIAEELGKEHKILLRDCRNCLEEGVEFVPSEYITMQNKKSVEYLVTKDGFILLMMNYQGYNDFKRAYINRFNEMERALRETQPKLPSYAEALRQLADKIEENDKLLAENSEMKPKAEFFDAVAESKTAIAVGEVAKVLGIKGLGRNNLFEFLRNKKVLMNNNQPYQKYIDCGYFRIVETKYNKPDGDTAITIKTLVYQKGVDFIRKLIEKEIDAE